MQIGGVIGVFCRLIFGLTVLACASASAQEKLQPPSGKTSSAQRFDALYQRLYLGDLSSADQTAQLAHTRALQRLLPAADAHRGRLLNTQHCILDFENAPKQGLAYASKQLAEALAANDHDAAIRFYFCRGGFQQLLATSHDALRDYQNGIDLARRMDSKPLVAWGLQLRGGIESLLGLYGKALADLVQARRMFVQLHLTDAADSILQSIGIAYRRLGYLDKAREYLTDSVTQARRTGHRGDLTVGLMQLGYADQDAGQFSKALTYFDQARQLAEKMNDRQLAGSVQLALAGVFNDLHRQPDALASLDRASVEFAASGDTADLGMLHYEYGRSYAQGKQHEAALTAFNAADKLFTQRGNLRYQQWLYKARAQTREEAGQAVAALADYKKYLAVHEQVERRRTDQQAQMLREQFDTERSNLENARLKSEQKLKDHQLDTLKRARRWQHAATVLLAALLGVLAVLVIRQVRKVQSWQRMASLDALTGISNRRGIEQFLSSAMHDARLLERPLSLLAIDVDRFKSINDQHGHAAGDQALIRIAHACQLVLREGDLIGRIGGEEFLAVLPGSSMTQAVEIAERVRSSAEQMHVDSQTPGIAITISVGVAEMAASDSGMDPLQRRADIALYRAKAEGRNRVATTPIGPARPAPIVPAST